jgi:hypothetical protein
MTIILVYMGKIKGILFAVRHREILMTDLGLYLILLLVDTIVLVTTFVSQKINNSNH